MPRILKYGFYIAFLWGLIGCTPSERAIEISQLDTNVRAGEPLYQTLCSGCHGTQGRGRIGPNLVAHIEHHDIEEFADYILEGPGSMPSFGYLDNQEIADIIAYIKTL